MRLDVDNLGSIFALGLKKGGKQSTPFARTATLSREMDTFFSGYMNHLADAYDLYVTYSGGDDAFVVGSWINVLHFARRLRADFGHFACANSDLSFSAGIFLCDEHFPVAKFAEHAAEAEEKAKDYESPEGREKDALCVFDHTLSWTQFGEMLQFSEDLLRCVPETGGEGDPAKISRVLLHRVHRMIKETVSERGRVNLGALFRNRTRLHYYVARQKMTHKEIKVGEIPARTPEEQVDQVTKRVLATLLAHFSTERDTQARFLQNFLIATHYVILKTRKRAR
ncbi:MAG: hypothetical protein D6722_04125 [Bacteroidetes bacterium]|nr:MAG: hypothetical protein D6722_04125 [Bacteroidota bacterium]